MIVVRSKEERGKNEERSDAFHSIAVEEDKRSERKIYRSREEVIDASQFSCMYAGSEQEVLKGHLSSIGPATYKLHPYGLNEQAT